MVSNLILGKIDPDIACAIALDLVECPRVSVCLEGISVYDERLQQRGVERDWLHPDDELHQATRDYLMARRAMQKATPRYGETGGWAVASATKNRQQALNQALEAKVRARLLLIQRDVFKAARQAGMTVRDSTAPFPSTRIEAAMTATATCPAPKELQRLLLGLVPDAEAAELIRHVKRCDHCLNGMTTLDAQDTMVVSLRESRANSSPEGIARYGLQQVNESLPGLVPKLRHRNGGLAEAARRRPGPAAVSGAAAGPRRDRPARAVPRPQGARLGRHGHRLRGRGPAAQRVVALKVMKPDAWRQRARPAALPARGPGGGRPSSTTTSSPSTRSARTAACPSWPCSCSRANRWTTACEREGRLPIARGAADRPGDRRGAGGGPRRAA